MFVVMHIVALVAMQLLFGYTFRHGFGFAGDVAMGLGIIIPGIAMAISAYRDDRKKRI